MSFVRRQFLYLAAGAAAFPAASRMARAQTYPTRPVRIVVSFPPGGFGDISARLVGQWLSERLGQQFVIENRPGAGGNIGTELVVRAPPDGYTLLLINTSNVSNPTLYDKLNFNFIRDIAPVASIVRVPHVMEVNPSFPAKTIAEFITYAKANPGKINMASGGNGNPSHLTGELFKMMTGVNMVHVPYRGGALAQYTPPQRRKNSATDRRATTGIGLFKYPTAKIDAVVKSAANANMVRYTWFGRPPRARHSSLIQPPTR
jgi:tripartite-type tricarboxylate transporter receptor subunit TctC